MTKTFPYWKRELEIKKILGYKEAFRNIFIYVKTHDDAKNLLNDVFLLEELVMKEQKRIDKLRGSGKENENN